MGQTPEVTVATIVQRGRQFLLVEERIRGRLLLNQPAGHLEAQETLVQAAIRETREETGCQVEPLWLVGIYQWSPAGRQHTTLRFAFAARLLAHDATQPLDQPIVATHWLSREALFGQRERWRTPMVGRCLEDYLAGQRIELAALPAVSALSDVAALSAVAARSNVVVMSPAAPGGDT